MRVVADVRQADAVTHGNVFHADEILATAILTKINPELKVARVFRVPQNLSPNTIVYDVGYGELDHHQKGGNGVRQNGVPYASAGLVWRRFGFQVVCNTCDPQAVWEHVDRVLVQGVDATDCGAMPLVKYPSQPQTISQAISGFYPTWDMDLTPDANGLTAADYAFEKAVTFMIAVLDNNIDYAASVAKAKVAVQESIERAENGVMPLSRYMPWKGTLMQDMSERARAIRVVVYPDNRSGYAWCVVPNRALAPERWRGLKGRALQQTSGYKTAVFVHSAGFMGGAASQVDALTMAYEVAANAETVLAEQPA